MAQPQVVAVRAHNKVLLNGVSGQINGGFWAVMGPSGSGKSTLLNALSLRLDPTMAVSGEMRLNGRPYTNSELKLASGYVMQDDLLNVNLTVEETLQYTARLRCPTEYTSEDRQARVEEVLGLVGLRHVRGVIVGSPLRKGISGGERKRLCVALELLTRPVILFLDEPTSGLDSVTALSLCRTLKKLASNMTESGLPPVTVVTTIHQPQTKIFALFDNLLLLRGGSTVYQGPAPDALSFFAANGFPCPEFTNPADHFLDIITPGISDSSTSLDKMEMQLNESAKKNVDLTYGAEQAPIKLREIVPWRKQFTVLLERSVKEVFRSREVMAAQIGQSVIMAILIGTVFLQIGTNQSSTIRRGPLIFFCAVNQGIFAALTTINMFPSERVLSLRERAAGSYYASAYFCAKMLADAVAQVICPVIFSCIVYWLVGLQPVASKFFIFMGLMVLTSLAATSMALMVSAWCRTTELSITLLPMALELARLFGGFFLSPRNLPKYFSWLDALAYVKYAYVGASLNELEGLELHCTPAELTKANGICPITNGMQTIDTLGLDYITVTGCACALLGYIVFCRIMAYLGVRYMKW